MDYTRTVYTEPVAAKSISIVIPAYNEAHRISPTLTAVDAFLKTLPYSGEIIIVDDCSTDGTRAVAETFAKGKPYVRVLLHERNIGKGAAVKWGMLSATGTYRLFTDADGSTDIKEWLALEPHFREGCDVAVGSRRIEGSSIIIHQGIYRETLGHIFRALVRTLVPVGVSDTQNGFKAFTGKAAEMLFSEQQTVGWAFDVEILMRARKKGMDIREVPIVWKNDRRSQMTLGGMAYALVELFRIRRMR